MDINTSRSILNLQPNINDWVAPELDEVELFWIAYHCLQREGVNEFFKVLQIEPYIDALYIRLYKNRNHLSVYRYTFHEGYYWDDVHESIFHERCIKNEFCSYSGGLMDEIYKVYSTMHPEWHLKRYYGKSLRLLDHIYNCLNMHTAKELLYKAGLDELAANIDELDEINLLATKPSELYDGLPIKLLRAINCKEGAKLLSDGKNRRILKELYACFPKLFSQKMNDVQCAYLQRLILNGLSAEDVEFSMRARANDLIGMWSKRQLDAFLEDERDREKILENTTILKSIDPIYDAYYKRALKMRDGIDRITWIAYLLLGERKEFDKRFRRSNRKRPNKWQEWGDRYIIRYPQTINDFCREAIYMRNCLFAYLEEFLENRTTILLMRRTEDKNTPYIVMEVCDNKLTQAYRKNNRACSLEEKEWIIEYCMRHGIVVDAEGFCDYQLSLADLLI